MFPKEILEVILNFLPNSSLYGWVSKDWQLAIFRRGEPKYKTRSQVVVESVLEADSSAQLGEIADGFSFGFLMYLCHCQEPLLFGVQKQCLPLIFGWYIFFWTVSLSEPTLLLLSSSPWIAYVAHYGQYASIILHTYLRISKRKDIEVWKNADSLELILNFMDDHRDVIEEFDDLNWRIINDFISIGKSGVSSSLKKSLLIAGCSHHSFPISVNEAACFEKDSNGVSIAHIGLSRGNLMFCNFCEIRLQAGETFDTSIPHYETLLKCAAHSTKFWESDLRNYHAKQLTGSDGAILDSSLFSAYLLSTASNQPLSARNGDDFGCSYFIETMKDLPKTVSGFPMNPARWWCCPISSQEVSVIQLALAHQPAVLRCSEGGLMTPWWVAYAEHLATEMDIPRRPSTASIASLVTGKVFFSLRFMSPEAIGAGIGYRYGLRPRTQLISFHENGTFYTAKLNSGPYGMVEKLINHGVYTVDLEKPLVHLISDPKKCWQHAYNEDKPRIETWSFEVIPGDELLLSLEGSVEIGGIEVANRLPTKVKAGCFVCYDVTHLIAWMNKFHPGHFANPDGDLMYTLTRETPRVAGFGFGWFS